jgi:6-pyruvoyl-tetrahydropterin synthase
MRKMALPDLSSPKIATVSCLFVEHLCVIDCASLHPSRGLLGESWIVDVELEGGLDEQGMVLDFGRVKPLIKSLIDETVDHKLLVPLRDPRLRYEEEGAEARLWYRYGDGELYHRSPRSALCLIDRAEISLPAVEAYVAELCAAEMPGNVSDVRITLREEDIPGPAYRYVHGLPKHDGHCQRIAHGHRSRIEVFREGSRCEASERWLAERWRDIYLGSRQDLVPAADGGACYHFRYRAPEGAFELIIGKDRCEVLETASTVEQIAQHAARLLAEREPGVRFRVRAYEGVRKGGIAHV